MNITEELMLRVPIDHTTATKLNKYIKYLYFSKYYYQDQGIFIEKCVDAIGKSVESFDNSKGVLIPYLKRGLNDKLKTQEPYIVELNEEILVDDIVIDDVQVDMSNYTDTEVNAMYEVLFGTPTKEHKQIVQNIFKEQT